MSASSFCSEMCWSRPWLARWLSLVWAAFFFVLGSQGEIDLGAGFLLAVTGAFLALLWLLALPAWLARRGQKTAKPASRRSLAAWWIPPGLAALLVATTLAGLPYRARFLVSEPQLTEFAERIRAGSVDARSVRGVSVGLFVVQSTELRDGRVYLITATGLPTVGFAYAPDGVPPRYDNPWVHEKSLGRHWWSIRSTS